MGEAPIAATDGMVLCRWCASYTAPAPFCQQCGSPSPKGRSKVRHNGPAEARPERKGSEATTGDVVQISCKWCCQLGPLQSLCANCGSPMLGNGSMHTHQTVPVAKAGPAPRPAARAIGPPPPTVWLKT